jgi:P4 family phage/plasmid primase-like protien
VIKSPPADALDKLCALAPAEPPAPSQSNIQKGKKREGKSPPPKLIVDQYLQHYGVEYQVKHDGTRTIYQLKECLFDPAHGNKQASIIESPGSPLHYQCFHDSCKGRTFKDARAKISGADSLALYCEGYDPNKQPVTRTKAPADPAPAGEAPKPFLTVNDKGRTTFNAARMAYYLYDQFKPLMYEGKDLGGSYFYRYLPQKGVWARLPEATIRHAAAVALGEDALSKRITDAVSLLGDIYFLDPEAFVVDPMILNMKNCMLDVRTMQKLPHAPEFHSKVQLPVNYDPTAKCPLWMETLPVIFEDDLNKITTIQQFFGYCFYPKIIFPAALFQIGGGNNGKGTVTETLESLLGEENISHISLTRMEAKFGAVEIKDKLLNSCGETANAPLEVTEFKALAAADPIQAEKKYENDVKFRPIAKHVISMNAFPGIKDKTHAFFRRVIVMEYKQTFGVDIFDDKGRKDALRKEGDGIANWSLEGLKEVLAKLEIFQPESVDQAKKRFRAHVNPILTWADECLDLGEWLKELPPATYKNYIAWCEDGNLKNPLGKQRFYEQLMTNFKIKRMRRHDSKVEMFEGCKLRDAQASFA